MTKLVRISAWAGFPELVRKLGADPVAVLAAAGLTLEDIQPTGGYLPYESFIRSLNAAVEATGRPDFGMLSARQGGLNVLGILGVAIRNAHTNREAFEICGRFIKINNSATSLASVRMPGTNTEFICMQNDFPLTPDTVQLYERIMSSVHVIFSAIGQEHHRPLEFRFMHAPVAPLSAYRAAYGKVPKFNQPSLGMLVETASMDAVITRRSAELGDLAMAHLRAFASRSEQPFADAASTIAKVLIELGACTPADMANALSVHERTMQRRLQIEGLSFEAVRDRARREIAEVLLRQDAHSLTEIAHILGYTDSSTFTRSCRRWFGDTPTAVRAKALSN